MLNLSFFGSPQYLLDGREIRGLASRKAEALLIYLACTERTHARESLATLLWDDRSHEQALANLSVLLTSMRKQINGYLQTSRHEVALVSSGDSFLDTRIFQQKLAEAETIRRRQGLLIPAAATLLDEALALYQDNFLAGFSLRDASGFEEWVTVERERYFMAATQALRELIRFHSEQKQFKQGIERATQLLSLDPLNEEAHRQLIYLLALDGQRGAAIAQFKACRDLLKRELGVEPDAETVTLYEQLLHVPVGQPVVKATQTVGGNPISSPIPPLPEIAAHNLPAELTPFVGRQPELAQIAARLTQPDCRLLTLVGAGGIGKTRLVGRAAFQQIGRFAHGVWFCSLVGVPTAELLPNVIAEAIGVAFSGSAPLPVQLKEYLRDKEMLLVLDNFEHLLPETTAAEEEDDAPAIKLVLEVIQVAPRVRFLITSRERLNVRGEWLLEVGGLPLPTVSQNEQWNENPAIQLFLQSVARINPAFLLDETAVAAIQQLCRLVGGMPLALEIAAAWSQTLTPAEIVAEVSVNLDFLSTRLRDLPARQRSVRAVFEASWKRLTTSEQVIFTALSVFWGEFSREAAQEVSGARVQELMALVDRSLLQRRGAGRFEVHELLRQFAIQQLARDLSKTQTLQALHSEYYARFVEQQYRQLSSPQQILAFTRIEQDLDNIRAAWSRAAEQKQLNWLGQMSQGVGDFLYIRGRFQEGWQLFQATVNQLAPLSEPERWHNLSKNLSIEESVAYLTLNVWLNCFRCDVGVITPIQRTYELIFSEITKLSDLVTGSPSVEQLAVSKLRAFALHEYAHYLSAAVGDHDSALSYQDESLALYRQLGELRQVARVLANQARALHFLGEYQRSKELAFSAQELCEQIGDQATLVGIWEGIGLNYTYQGELAVAKDYLLKTLQVAEATLQQAHTAGALLNLGIVNTFLGQFEQGRQAWQRGYDLCVKIGDRNYAGHLQILLGYAYLYLGDNGEAIRCAQRGIELTLAIDYWRGVGLGEILLGSAQLACGQSAAAIQTLTNAIVTYQKVQHEDELAWAWAVQAYALRAEGDPVEAGRAAVEAIDHLVDNQAFHALYTLLPVLALLLHDGQYEQEAMLFYKAAWQSEFVKQSCWFAMVAGNEFAERMQEIAAGHDGVSQQPTISELLSLAKQRLAIEVTQP